MPPPKIWWPKIFIPPVNHSAPIIIPRLYIVGARALKTNRPTACWIEVITVAIANRNGLMAITRIILVASTCPDSDRPGPTTYLTSTGAKIIIRTDATIVTNARKFIRLVLICQALSRLFLAIRELNTGINVTANAPLTKIRYIKSGIVKATV